MITIGFDVDKQIVTKRKNSERLVNNSANYLKLCFNFKEETSWDEVTSKRVLFTSKHSKVYCKELDANNTVVVPWEVLTEKYFLFTLYGIDENDLRITTTQKRISLEESGFTEEIEKDLPHNSSIVEDIYNKLNNTIEMEVTFEDGSTNTYDVVVK